MSKVYTINEGTGYHPGTRVRIVDTSDNTPSSTKFETEDCSLIQSSMGCNYKYVFLQMSDVTEVIEERFNPAKEAAKQVGGSHYESLAIQPWEYFTANASHAEIVGACKQNILKYMRDKNNRIEDIQKLIWYAEAWLKQEKSNGTNT